MHHNNDVQKQIINVMAYYSEWEIEGYLNEYVEWLDEIFTEKGYNVKSGICEDDEYVGIFESEFLDFLEETKFPYPQNYRVETDGTYVDVYGDFAEAVYFYYQKCKRFHKVYRYTKTKAMNNSGGK